MEFRGALAAVWELIAAVNKYLVETEPWTLAERKTMPTARGWQRCSTPPPRRFAWRPGCSRPSCRNLQRGSGGSLARPAIFRRSRSMGFAHRARRRREDRQSRTGFPAPRERRRHIENSRRSRSERAKNRDVPSRLTLLPRCAAQARSQARAKLPIDDFLKLDSASARCWWPSASKGASKLLRLEVESAGGPPDFRRHRRSLRAGSAGGPQGRHRR